MPPFSLYIFGVTGNLSQIKVLPSIYDLFAANLVPPGSKIIGVGRKNMSREEFARFALDTISTPRRHHEHDIDPLVWEKMKPTLDYLGGEFDSDDTYSQISLHHQQNRIFYLATPPDLYTTLFSMLKKHKLNQNTSDSWTRLLVEKPIGSDLASAKKLNSLLEEFFQPSQIFRLDHYLGKDTLQNIITFRFGNGLFEPLMHSDYIDNIQITAAEDFGVGERGGYYDTIGCLRDVGQNHLLQMLTAATMDAPTEFSNDAVTAERIKILKLLQPMPEKTILGQYQGYKQESKVLANSNTDTYFAVECRLNHPRFAGVPIYLRAGKKLERTVTEIAIVFKNYPNRLFTHLEKGLEPNALIYRIQPNEGIVFSILTKTPGHSHQLENTYMQFCYKDLGNLPDAYERLLVDAIKGDQTFFNDPPEIELQWKFVDTLLANRPQITTYQPGSWGPKDNFPWLPPSTVFCRL